MSGISSAINDFKCNFGTSAVLGIAIKKWKEHVVQPAMLAFDIISISIVHQ